MIIPSIDLMGGQTVQLVGGREKALEAGDPLPLARGFSIGGEVAVIDLDAAIGGGDNAELVEKVCGVAECRVGGGIRSVEAARKWLDAGAAKVILGTAAKAELLKELPKERVIAAVDCENGEVVVKGWREKTGRGVVEVIQELRSMVGGFLVTFVEREGRLGGINLARVREVVEAAGDVRVTVAGGVTTVEEVAEIDRLGADAQVGMALYTGKMSFADAVVAPMVSDRADGLWPTVVVDERGVALGLAYSSRESVREAVRLKRGVYHSRKRGVWVKGETSGDTQELLKIDLDCDRDALRFTVRQRGGYCHLKTRTCWGEERGLGALSRLLEARRADAPAGSYTKRLFEETGLLDAKLKEEVGELCAARSREEVEWEAADVMYFAMAKMAKEGVSLAEVERALDRRARRVTRRKGDAKV